MKKKIYDMLTEAEVNVIKDHTNIRNVIVDELTVTELEELSFFLVQERVNEILKEILTFYKVL